MNTNKFFIISEKVMCEMLLQVAGARELWYSLHVARTLCVKNIQDTTSIVASYHTKIMFRLFDNFKAC